MSDLAQWSALVGFLIPLLISIVQQPYFSRRLRTIIGMIASVIAAFFTAWLAGKVDFHQWATSLIFIAITAWTSYRNVWVPAGASPYIEHKTTSAKGRRHIAARGTP